jgi:PAS domain S-box-containing protein
MIDAFLHFFDSSGFTPHGHCFLWTPSLLWSYVVADSVIALSYYSIPVALWYFVRKRRDVPFRWVFVMFGVFVMACGTTHILAIWDIWQPDYWTDAAVKGLTAVASVVTAFFLWPLIPRALAIPSQAQLERVNTALQNEIAEREHSEARLEAFLDNSAALMFIKDLDGRYLHVNQSFLRSYGLTRERVLLRSDAELFDREQATQFQTNDAKAIAAGTSIQVEQTARYADGGSHTTLVSKFPIFDASGRITALGGIAADITQRKQAEEQIRRLNEDLISRTAELETSNKELEGFCYSVSHDLRAPLRAIDGFRALLASEFAAGLASTATAYLERIGNAAQQMGQLIDALLFLSRISREPLDIKRVDLSTMVADIAAKLEQSDPHRRVTWRIAPDLGVEGDAKLLRIALENLMGNAWKFTGKTARAQIEFGGDDGVFFVRDNGTGFSMAYGSKLFRAFERLHTPKEFPGIGAGLATAERILRRHRGRIWAEAAEGQGATFFFELGANQQA